MSGPPDDELRKWHRYFAVENNNRAWDIAGQQSRTPAEEAEMLNAAHAAAIHWNAVGTELNRMRATTLLAAVHALLGFNASARQYAAIMRAFFLVQESPDWEVALVHAISAHAAAIGGETGAHRESYAAAAAALEAIADPADRAIVMQTFSQVPEPRMG